jgi:hypothetical protein
MQASFIPPLGYGLPTLVHCQFDASRWWDNFGFVVPKEKIPALSTSTVRLCMMHIRLSDFRLAETNDLFNINQSAEQWHDHG